MINSTPDSIDFMELDASIKGKDKGRYNFRDVRKCYQVYQC